MLGEKFYEEVQKRKVNFLIMSFLAIVFMSGIMFTSIIPTLKGFEWVSLLIALMFYFLIANLFVGLFEGYLTVVFLSSLLLSALGMGWRLWLEWGEVSLIEHMNFVVMIGYPTVIALIISVLYVVSATFKSKLARVKE